MVTNKERQVIELVSKGMTNKEVARAMGISPNTVREYLKNVFRKNNLKSRAQAVAQLGSI